MTKLPGLDEIEIVALRFLFSFSSVFAASLGFHDSERFRKESDYGGGL